MALQSIEALTAAGNLEAANAHANEWFGICLEAGMQV